MLRVETIGFHQLGGLAALAEEVVYGHYLDGAGSGAGQYSGNELSETTGYKVLLGRNHRSGLGSRGEYGFSVQGFDGMYVDYFCGDSLFLQFLCGKEGFPYQMAGGEDCHVFSVNQFQGFPDLELLVLRGEIGHGGTAEPQVHRSFVGCGCDGGSLGLVVVAG